jgi:hypothetical protein
MLAIVPEASSATYSNLLRILGAVCFRLRVAEPDVHSAR